MIKKYYVLFFFLLCISIGFGQTKEIDSLKNSLKLITSNNDKMNFYDQLAKSYLTKDIIQSQAYNDSLLELSKQFSNKKMEFNSIFNNSCILKLKGKYKESIKQSSIYLEYTKSINDSLEISNAHFQLGSAYYYLDNKEDAIFNFFEALKNLENKKGEAKKAKIYNSIGIVYSSLSQYEKSKVYQNKALNIAVKAKDSIMIPIIYNGLGINLKSQDSTEKALHYFRKSLLVAEKINNIRIMGYQYRNIGSIESINGNYLKAEPLLEKALAIRRNAKDKLTIGGSLSDLANVYMYTDRLEKAEIYFNEAITIFKEIKSISSENAMYYDMSILESKRGNSMKAFNLLDKYYFVRDSLHNIDLQAKVNDIDIKYQTVQKDKEIADQKLALNESETKTRTMNIIIISLLIGSMLLWFLFQQRQKRIQQQLVAVQREQEVRTLESLMEGEEKERFRIAKELHDGVNGDLSAIKFKLSSLLEMNNTVIKEAVSMIDNSCEQVRAISHNLVPPSLKNFNLVEAVEEYCQSMNSIHEPEVHFQEVGNPIVLDKKQEANLFRIVQELVTNSIKHAQAKEINVQLSHQENILQLTVEDNGKGFDPKAEKGKGIGMQNVQSRVDYLNATIDFLSNEKGTSYTITMEIKKQEL